MVVRVVTVAATSREIERSCSEQSRIIVAASSTVATTSKAVAVATVAAAVVAAVTAAIAPLYPDPRCLRVCLHLFTPSPLPHRPRRAYHRPHPSSATDRRSLRSRVLRSPLPDSQTLRSFPFQRLFLSVYASSIATRQLPSLFISRPKRSVRILPRQRPAHRF